MIKNNKNIVYAGFLIRFLAHIIDMIITFLIFSVAGYIFYFFKLASLFNFQMGGELLLQNSFSFVVTILFWRFF